ncbi:MAG: exopolyphosphatase [Jatrophihabitans sp.]
MTEPVVAAVDCGTNSVRLLVARVGETGLVELHREMRIVRLGEGLDRTGRLAAAALARTAEALRDYAGIIERLGAQRVRLVATSAARDAANRDEFEAMVRAALGVDADIISGAEEASLSLRGALCGLADDRPALVLDIGGGSTELVLGGSGESTARAAVSMDVGCVRLTERWLHDDPPTTTQVDGLCADVADHLVGLDPLLKQAAGGSVIGVAGTVTTIAALALELPGYDRSRIHRTALPIDAVLRVTDELLAMSHAERVAQPVIHPGRVDVIVAGALILRTILNWGGAVELIASESDILDGIAMSLATLG